MTDGRLMDRPFIYVASLRRTGSTVLSEALTLLPYSFIFREPKLGQNRFAIKQSDAALFLEHGIDLYALEKRWRLKGKTMRIFGQQQEDYMLAAFKDELMPRLLRCVSQVGVKEIGHSGWRMYLRQFPDMKIVLTGRDPRDIYLSLYYRMKSGKAAWHGAYTPRAVAEDLNREFRHQRDMASVTECLQVKYENLCTDPTMPEQIKSFIRSPIPTIGAVGSFNAVNPVRRDEYAIHGDQITDRQVNRWKGETDQKLLQEARETFELMAEYCEFWGYEK